MSRTCSVGGDLEGQAIQAVFFYDTSLGVETTDGSTFDEIDAGADYGVSAVTAVTYSIAGHSYEYVPDEFQDLTTQAFTSASEPGFLSFAAYSSGGDESFVQIETQSAPALLSTPFQGQADPGSVGSLYTYFLPGRTSNADQLDSITFNVTDVSSSAVSVAPEPTTWWLLLLGTAVTGLALRRRKLEGVLLRDPARATA